MSEPELEKIRMEKLKRLMSSKGKNVEDEPAKARADVSELRSSNFDEVLAANRFVLVDFWADWCAPCRMMAPIFKELAKTYGDRVLFARLNVDENPDTANRYYVQGIPTFILFKGSQPLRTIVGAVGRGPLENLLREIL